MWTKYNPSDFEVTGKDLLPLTTWLLVGDDLSLGALEFGKRPVLVHRTSGLRGDKDHVHANCRAT